MKRICASAGSRSPWNSTSTATMTGVTRRARSRGGGGPASHASASAPATPTAPPRITSGSEWTPSSRRETPMTAAPDTATSRTRYRLAYSFSPISLGPISLGPISLGQHHGQTAADHCRGSGVAARRAQQRWAAGEPDQLQRQHHGQRSTDCYCPGKRAPSPPQRVQGDCHADGQWQDHGLIGKIGQKIHPEFVGR